MDDSKQLRFYGETENKEEAVDEDVRSEDAAIECNLQSGTYRWSRSLLDFSFAFIGCDPFAIYAQEKICERTSDTSAPIRRLGLLRSRWANISMLFSVYLATKTTSAFLLRCAIVYLADNPSGASKQLVGPLEQILAVVGDPFACLSSVRMIIYFIDPWWCFAACSVLPIYLAHYHTLDCPIGRFLLEPKREMQRFDAEAKEYLCQIVETIEKRRLELTENYWMARMCHVNQGNTLVHLRRARQQLKQLTILKGRLNALRPKTLGADWHKRSYESFYRLFPKCLAANFAFGTLMYCSFNLITWRLRCDDIKSARMVAANATEDSWNGCSLLEAFSPTDVLMMVEIMFQLLFIGIYIFGFFLSIHYFQVSTQICLTDSVHEKLARTLDELHIFNQNHRARPEVSGQRAREQLDVRLSKSLLSLWMFKKESEANVNFLAQIEIIFTWLLFAVTLVTFAAINLSATWAKFLQSEPNSAARIPGSLLVLAGAKWVFVLLNSNLLLLHCATIPARANKLKRSVFSIMAELSRTQAISGSLRSSFDHQQKHPARIHRAPVEDPLIALWRRFVMSELFAEDQPSVEVFSVRLTYEQVLKVNFYVATTISLLTLRK